MSNILRFVIPISYLTIGIVIHVVSLLRSGDTGMFLLWSMSVIVAIVLGTMIGMTIRVRRYLEYPRRLEIDLHLLTANLLILCGCIAALPSGFTSRGIITLFGIALAALILISGYTGSVIYRIIRGVK